MKPWNRNHYHLEAFKAFPRYALDNSWFRWFDNKEMDMVAPVSYVFAAWSTYEKAQEPSSEMLLLGDTKLRTNEALVTNFGLSSGKGVQEEKDKELIDMWMKTREKIAKDEVSKEKPPYWMDPNTKIKGVKPIDIVGPGSILSTRSWSPLLNDTFVISGAHKEREFLWALTGEEKADFADAKRKGGNPKEVWLRFMTQYPGSIWSQDAEDTGKGWPRVLMRELLGLGLFGYRPYFNENQLGFGVEDNGKSDAATFDTYLIHLKNLEFHKNNKAKLFQALGTFLFKDPKAFDPVLSNAPAKASA